MLSEAQKNQVAEELMGTCNTVDSLAQEFGVEDDEIEAAAEEKEVGRCETCGWWVETCELDEEGNCEDHKDE